MEDVLYRFFQQVSLKDDCWEWTGSKNLRGYGNFYTGSQVYGAHRFIGIIFHGKDFNTNKVIDHLCRNPSCVNPYHMELVTSLENTLRGDNHVAIRAKSNKCFRGHLYSKSNLLQRKANSGNIVRQCKKCKQYLRRKRYLDLGV